jgi:hypothetical protein
LKKKLIFILLLTSFQSSCATLEWSNKYGTDFCAYPSGVFVGVPTGIAAGVVAGPVLGAAMGVLAGGTMLLNSWTNYGGLDVKECVESYKKNVLNDPVPVQ